MPQFTTPSTFHAISSRARRSGSSEPRRGKRPKESQVHDRIMELEAAIAEVPRGRKASMRTTRLVAAGLPRMAQEMVEEVMEIVTEAVRRERTAVINESVYLLYNLVVTI
jgi:phosphoribosyl-ATP pyrophosphohydrolase